MKKELVGQFARMPNGERVLVEMVGADREIPARAIVRHIEGERVGTRATIFVSRLEMLGYEIPKEDTRTEASA